MPLIRVQLAQPAAILSWVSCEELQRTFRAEVLAQPFHEELWSEGPGARPLLGASYEQVKQTKHTGKKGGWARPEVRWPDLCPFQMKCGSSSNRSRVADRVLVLQLGVRPLRWESQVQDIGPPETSQTHVISISKSSQRDLHLNAKTQLNSMTSKLQCWTPYAKQLARQEHNPTY